LIIPEAGFGTNFNVLMQSKNVETPEISDITKKQTKSSKSYPRLTHNHTAAFYTKREK